MSIVEFDPNQITVTPEAARHILDQIRTSGSRYLRLGVKESGCNGYMYTLDYVDGPGPDDRPFAVADGLSVYVGGADLELVRGTEVDLVREGLNTNLRFKNPNAAGYCGCGESFSIDED
jgi:iron-sulfur cluster assembly accessory protein